MPHAKGFGGGVDPAKEHHFCPSAKEALCRPKLQGGLGFKQFKHLNHVLLTKLAWRLLTEPYAL